MSVLTRFLTFLFKFFRPRFRAGWDFEYKLGKTEKITIKGEVEVTAAPRIESFNKTPPKKTKASGWTVVGRFAMVAGLVAFPFTIYPFLPDRKPSTLPKVSPIKMGPPVEVESPEEDKLKEASIE